MLNAAAHLVFSLQKYDPVPPLLQQLHWLKVEQPIILIFRCLHSLAPPYLANDLQRVSDLDSRKCLRYASTGTLVIPTMNLFTVGGRAFPVAATQTCTVHRTLSHCHCRCPRSTVNIILFAQSYKWVAPLHLKTPWAKVQNCWINYSSCNAAANFSDYCGTSKHSPIAVVRIQTNSLTHR